MVSSPRRRRRSTRAPTPTPPSTRADKRGAELAIESVFGAERCLFARPGLILGPRENIGRLPWWLRRIAAGGDVLAPGPQDLAVQYIDARDLAAFAIDTALNGAVNVLSRPGHTTMAEVLDLCREVTDSTATFTWVDADFLLEHKVEPWTELPIWVPPVGDMANFYTCDSSLALRSGLTCRSARETVEDTWSWLRDNPDWAPVVERQSLGASAWTRSARRRCSPPGPISRPQPVAALSLRDELVDRDLTELVEMCGSPLRGWRR